VGYLVAVAAGLFVIALMLAAGGLGYAIANAPTNHTFLTSIGVASALLIGVAGSVFGSIAYTRLQTVAVVTIHDRASPTASAASNSQIPPAETASDTPQPATDGWLHFQSDNRDFIGGGVQKVWTLKESDLSIGGSNHNIVASVSGQGDWWYLNFRGPSNGDLHTATYTNAERAPFVTGKAPGLDVNGDGRGCNTLSGRFQIKSLVWTTAGTVAEMDVLFEQHCEGGTPALRGELWVTTELGVHKAAPSASSAVTF